MKDVVVGCITNYDFNKIKYWVNSLEKSGFSGDKVMICYDVDYDTCEELTRRGFSIFAFGRDDEKRKFVYRDKFSIVVERFFHQWFFLKKFSGQYRYIISTDVKDVIFQNNPSIWLENNLGNKKINVGSECIRYKDEDWGKNNLMKSFGKYIYDENCENVIYNAGTIAGDFDTMMDLFLNVYMLCNSTSHFIEGGGGPDQAALNILLNFQPYKNIVNFAPMESGWAAQLGTTGPQIQSKYGDKLTEKVPIIENDCVMTSAGVPFTLVHQYDRVPDLREKIEKIYG